MYEEKIFSGNTIQEVAKIFSEEISRQYLKHLKFWQITSIDDNDELKESQVWYKKMYSTKF